MNYAADAYFCIPLPRFTGKNLYSLTASNNKIRKSYWAIYKIKSERGEIKTYKWNITKIMWKQSQKKLRDAVVIKLSYEYVGPCLLRARISMHSPVNSSLSFLSFGQVDNCVPKKNWEK